MTVVDSKGDLLNPQCKEWRILTSAQYFAWLKQHKIALYVQCVQLATRITHTHTIFDTIISYWKLMVSSLAPGNVSTSGTPNRPSVPCSSSGTAASQLPKEGKLKVSAFGSVGPRRNPASQGPIPATAEWIGILLCWLSHCPICSIKEIWLET